MNKKLITISAAAILLGTALLLPAGAAAFWPFDAVGQVLGAQAPSGGGFMGLLERFMGHGTTVPSAAILNQSGPSGATGVQFPPPFGLSGATGAMGVRTDDGGLCNAKTRLDAAVTAGKLTSSQESAILTQANAICAEQQKLASMQAALYQWFKTNNISTSVFVGEPPHPMPMMRGPSGATGFVPHGDYRTSSHGYVPGNAGGGQPSPTSVVTNTSSTEK